ncbi:hypothetical protein D5R55_09545 [Burkholderia cenocepacia]|uniref:Uncharacterized protein n=1 Tax=Burkholderia cenocepacia TaxID=95486 RepID=A0A3S9N6C0_9BURK|nr:hypothetical protein D5R55_09545 [Burkholderia cenocepacia]
MRRPFHHGQPVSHAQRPGARLVVAHADPAPALRHVTQKRGLRLQVRVRHGRRAAVDELAGDRHGFLAAQHVFRARVDQEVLDLIGAHVAAATDLVREQELLAAVAEEIAHFDRLRHDVENHVDRACLHVVAHRPVGAAVERRGHLEFDVVAGRGSGECHRVRTGRIGPRVVGGVRRVG